MSFTELFFAVSLNFSPFVTILSRKKIIRLNRIVMEKKTTVKKTQTKPQLTLLQAIETVAERSRDSKLSNDFMTQQAELTQQLQDSVMAYLREYNADGHYHLVLNDAVLMNKVAGYDITNEVIEALNARYTK